MSFDWYPWHIQKYRAATMHLGLAECGAYRRLIDEYMMTRKPLPDNDAALARIIGVSLDGWLAVAPAVRPFFEASHGKLINNTCEEELNTQRIHAEQRSDRARAAINARWDKHRQLKEKLPGVYAENTLGILKHTTRQDKERKNGEPLPARSLASALPTGALAREPGSAQAAKRPSEMTRAELDAQIALKRAATS